MNRIYYAAPRRLSSLSISLRRAISTASPILAQTSPTTDNPPATSSSSTPTPRKPHKQSTGRTLLPPRPSIPDSDLHEKFLAGSGPGGQKINKTASAVQLTHIPTGIVLKCQATRSRIQNRKIARQLLAEKIELMEKGSQSRVALKGERISRRKKSGEKKRRRKYRALDGGEEDDDEEGENGEEGGDGEVGDGGSVLGDTLAAAAGNSKVKIEFVRDHPVKGKDKKS